MSSAVSSEEEVDITSLYSCESPSVPFSGFFDDSDDDMSYDGCDDVWMMTVMMYLCYDSDDEESESEVESEDERE